jgi:hypothetical protein
MKVGLSATALFALVAVGQSIDAQTVPVSSAAPASAASGAPLNTTETTPAALTTLKEIGHVHAQTAFCQAVYDHAGASTSTALAADASLASTAQYLTKADLDENAMAKPKAIYDIQRSYEALMAETKDAIEESKALRKLAADAPTPEQKAALITYADAIGGALHRQQLIGRDYRAFGVYLEAHDPVPWQDHDYDLSMATVKMPRPEEMAQDPRDRVATPLAQLSKEEAIHMADSEQQVLADEVHAASTVDAAFGPCPHDAAP